MDTKLKCFIDMDGVLVDFLYGAARDNYYDPNTGKLEIRELKQANSNFWINLPPNPEGLDLIRKLDQLRKEGVKLDIIVLALVLSDASAVGKKTWLKAYLNGIEHNLVIIWKSKDKNMFADLDSVLIDDYSTSCDSFRTAGGNSILFKGNSDSVIGKIREMVNYDD